MEESIFSFNQLAVSSKDSASKIMIKQTSGRNHTIAALLPEALNNEKQNTHLDYDERRKYPRIGPLGNWIPHECHAPETTG
jgi:hypothetical protein